MAYSIDPIQDSCYPGTTVLINKLDIRDEAALNEAEALATFVNASKLEQHPLEGAFDFTHYKAVHHFLFSDLYDWAGQIRTVNISKKGTRFCPAEEIVDFYCATNELHPFREGNGRSQRAFLSQLIRGAGYDINWADIDGDLLMIATIQAAQGVTDLLRQIFLDSI